MFIRSERLFLRPGWPEDREELSRQIDSGAPSGPLFGTQSAEATAAEATAAHATIGPVPREGALRRFPQFLVTLPGADGARLVGCAGLLDGEHGSELLCWIAPEFSGQGYATEAGRAVLSLARTLGHRRIAALDGAGSAAARRVLAKLDFHATGERCLHPCPVWGVMTESLIHRRDLGQPSDCDGMARGDARCAA